MIALKFEGIHGPSGPYELCSFQDPEMVKDCKVMCDTELGGYSKAELDWVPPKPPTAISSPREANNGYARFHGKISTKLPEDRPKVQRLGYAAWRTEDQKSTIFGGKVWDIDSYAFLALRVKSDGRSYFVNVQTESVEPTDLHQHRLFAKRPGEWETILINWNDFVRTNRGYVVEPQTEIMRQKVRTVGIGLTDRVPGPFEICIQRIWATNNMNESGQADLSTTQEGELRNKHGEHIKWDQREQ